MPRLGIKFLAIVFVGGAAAALLFAHFAALAQEDEGRNSSAQEEPATIAAAIRILDLRTFPVMEGAELAAGRRVAGLSYRAPGDVKAAFEFQQAKLSEQGWKEMPNRQLAASYASSMFAREGFILSVSISPSRGADHEGQVDVRLLNLGNVAYDKLPLPDGVKPFYSFPGVAAFITESGVEPTRGACRKLLMQLGWEPYGQAGDQSFFKRNAIRLSASVSSAPGQGGKTVITFSGELMSADLPAPAETEKLQYSDSTRQLNFDSAVSQTEIADYYRQRMQADGWQATTDELVAIDWKKFLVFRNPQKDMLTLETYIVEGATRVILAYQTAEEVAEQERKLAEAAERKRQQREKPLPKVVLALPRDARSIERKVNRIEFTVGTGRAKQATSRLSENLREQGWAADESLVQDNFGALTWKKDGKSVSITFVETGVLPPEITVTGIGVEIEATAK